MTSAPKRTIWICHTFTMAEVHWKC